MQSIETATGAEHARGYAICTTQRSGSTYLCELLSSTGVLGQPQDYFNGSGRRAVGWHDYPDDPEQQLATLLLHGSTANGVYGFKVFAEHLDALVPTDWARRLPGLQWVFLHREDLLAQAISLVVAKQTGRWRSSRAAGAGDAVYDAQAIRDEMASIARDNARWRLFFALSGVQPLEIPYEAVVVEPQEAARAVASLLSVEEPVVIDPSRVRVGIQRNDVSAEWRARFMQEARGVTPAVDALERDLARPRAGSLPAIVVRRPRLTVSIITKDSASRLPRLLDEVSNYADEIIVGVDASSADRTLDVAAAGADAVYQFRLAQPGQLAPARMLPFAYANGDWILSLDDDESMEDSFDALAPELMRARGGVTHYYFPRKWVVSDDPWEYVHAAPWYPNWAPRMFRNDASLVWKPAVPHSMYHVQGPGYHESRTAILHYEPLWCTPERRGEKLESYRTAGAATASEDFYAIPAAAPRRRLDPRTATARSRPARSVLHPGVRELAAAGLPPWRSAVLRVDTPASVRVGETVVAEVTVRNTGKLAWTPTYAQWPAELWPLIRLSFHLLDADGAVIDWDSGLRMQLARFVAPGDDVTFIEQFTAPAAPGSYVLEWDMLSENYCWFAACGGTVYRSRLKVLPA